jgi:hypothetical protein
MMFDHDLIITEALRSLRLHIAHFPIGYEPLPKKFTLPEIHALYATIIGKTLDYRNFSNRLMAKLSNQNHGFKVYTNYTRV